MRLAVLTALVLVLSIAAAFLLGRTEYDVLFNELEPQKAGEILTALSDLGVSYRTQGADTVLVPRKQVSELRMRLASEGIAPGIGNTPVIFRDLGSGFGTTDMEKRTYLTYQHQADLRAAINRMEKIEDSMVFLNLPQPSSYVLSQNEQAPSASIMLRLKSDAVLTNEEATGIAEMLSSAVAIDIQNIRVIDSKMTVYKLGYSEESSAIAVTRQMELERMVRERLENQVVRLLAPVFGSDNVRAAVSVSLNFDKETVHSVEFAPPVEGETTGLIISMSELYESARDGYLAGGIPGTDTNGIGELPYYPYGGLNPDEYYSRVLREMNFEINETTTQLERAQGTIRSLTIAVLLDSVVISEDFTNSVRNLVSRAVGVNDVHIAVERMPFRFSSSEIDKAIAQQQSFMRAMQRRELIKYIINALVVLLLAAMIFALVRTIMRARETERKLILAAEMGPGVTVDLLTPGDGTEGITLADIDISGKTDAIRQLEQFIDRDPQAVAQLLRNWLLDDYR